MPPVGLMVREPSEFPQVEFVEEYVALIAKGCVMVNEALAVHPFPSVTNTL